MDIISVKNLKKSYQRGKTPALRGLDFNVQEGEIYGIIGPDGAGKTTLFRILTTLLLADEGSATVDGCDVRKEYRKIRRRIGYMPGRFSLYQDLSVEENLRFFATIFHTTLEENYELVRDIYCQIEPFRTRKAGQLSGGMKQKLALCCALIHAPPRPVSGRTDNGSRPGIAQGILGNAEKVEKAARDDRRSVHTLYGRSDAVRPHCTDSER